MARKGWDQLSPGYRARLERNGIGKTAYGRGESIKEARGHARTPERPEQAIARPSQFPQYQAERTALTRRVAELKNHWFNTSPKWNPLRAIAKFRKDPPPMAKLRVWVKLTREEWLDAIREDPNTAAYLGYH